MARHRLIVQYSYRKFPDAVGLTVEADDINEITDELVRQALERTGTAFEEDELLTVDRWVIDDRPIREELDIECLRSFWRDLQSIDPVLKARLLKLTDIEIQMHYDGIDPDERNKFTILTAVLAYRAGMTSLTKGTTE